MAKYLVIVESPAKVKTIQKFLGSNYEVLASQGHVRDLPKSQLGIDVESGNLAEGVEAQAHCSMKNLGAVLEAAGSSYKNVVKTLIFLTDMSDFAAVNKIYESYFEGDFPARSCVQVAKLPLGGLVEIECVAEG